MLPGLRSTLWDGTDMLSEWKVRRVTWPLSTAAITDLVNLIKLQACTFLHCGLDESCGATVVSDQWLISLCTLLF